MNSKHLTHGELAEQRVWQAAAVEGGLAPPADGRSQGRRRRSATGDDFVAPALDVFGDGFRRRCEAARLTSGREPTAVALDEIGERCSTPARWTEAEEEDELRQTEGGNERARRFLEMPGVLRGRPAVALRGEEDVARQAAEEPLAGLGEDGM
jgi:hypothetical protein